MRKKIYQSLIELTNGPFTSNMIRKFALSKWSKYVIKPYSKFYAVNLDELKEDINQFKNLHSFFTRELKEGARQIDNREGVIVSPVDGVLSDTGKIEKNKTIIVKNKEYSILEMLGSEELTNRFIDGTYIILYLSPAHYHRIHSPISGKIISSYSLGSTSYPVNKIGLKYGDFVLSKNYRRISYISHDNTSIAVIKVGAMFINSVVMLNDKEMWTKGEEIAYFSFGSTVILLFEKDSFEVSSRIKASMNIKMGEEIGKIRKAPY